MIGPVNDPEAAIGHALRTGDHAGGTAQALDLVRAHPEHARGWHLLAVGALRIGRWALATSALSRSILLFPSGPESYGTLAAAGATDSRSGAMMLARRAFLADPTRRSAARLLALVGNPTSLLLHDALHRHPTESPLWVALSRRERERGSRAGHERAMRRAAVLAPATAYPLDPPFRWPASSVEAAELLGIIRRADVLDRSAGPAWLRVVACQPSMVTPEDRPEQLRARLEEAIGSLADRLERSDGPEKAGPVGHVGLFRAAYWGIDDFPLLRRFGQITTAAARATTPPPRPTAVSGRPLSVGMISGHASNHAVWMAIGRHWASVLRAAGCHTTLYDVTGVSGAEQAATFTVVDQRHRLPKSWAEAVSSAGHQVLLYPEIGMDATTLALANQRLAPLQIAGWGHPTSSGLPTIDLYLGAERFDPPGAEDQYVERLVRLPGVGVPVRPDLVPPAPLDRRTLGLQPEDGVLVACQSVFKYLPAFDSCLAEIAVRYPRSRFLMFEIGTPWELTVWRSRLLQAFGDRGLDPYTHLRFLQKLDLARFRRLLACADGYLDPPNFSGFNTGLLAIESGCPPVTIEGPRLRQRLCAGLLREAGATSVIARDSEDYVKLSVRLMRDPAFRARCRSELRNGLPRLGRDTGFDEAFLKAIGLAALVNRSTRI